MRLPRRPFPTDDRACAFCNKRHDQVAKLIAGPGVYICDDCIRVANEILEEDGIPTRRA